MKRTVYSECEGCAYVAWRFLAEGLDSRKRNLLRKPTALEIIKAQRTTYGCQVDKVVKRELPVLLRGKDVGKSLLKRIAL